MAEVTEAALNGQFEQIRDETVAGANTKLRVYNALKNLYDTLKGALAGKDLSINTRPSTETNYNLALTDRAGMVKTTTASANTITVLPTSSISWPVGFQCMGRQAGAGQTTFVPGTGVTIYSADGLKVAKQHGMWSLIHEGNNVWALAGGMTA